MIPVLAVFVDSLKPESIECMEFLDTLRSKVRIRTDLPSYSNTCHASMYTGVYPEKHKHFFIWKFSPMTSPFKIFSKLKLQRVIHDKRLKFLCYAVLTKLKFGVVPYGFLFFAEHSMDYWMNFDFEMVKFWGKPDLYVGNYSTIFNILKCMKIKYRVDWIPKGPLNRISLPKYPNPFTYIFIGHMDPITHKYGQDSLEAKRMLRLIDDTIKNVYFKFEKLFDDFLFIVFSDHGQVKIRKRINLRSLFRSNGKFLNDYIHFIDSCYARFWFRNDQEKKKVLTILNNLDDIGYVLTDEILKYYHAKMPRECGELIFYLRKSYVFDVVNPKAISMHGYLPDYDLDGVCISNKKIVKKKITLQDISPSILKALSLNIPDYMDGEPIWK